MRRVIACVVLLALGASLAGCPVDDVVARRRCDDAAPCDAH